jgi:hypothetical protein
VAAGANVITVYYFFGNKRCVTCNNMERFTKTAVTEAYAEDCAKGTLRFLSLNTDDPANAHFIEDFQLTMKLVVLAEERDGTVVRFAKLDQVWDAIKDEVGFKTYLTDSIAQFRTPRAP